MITNKSIFEEFEKKLLVKEKADYRKNLFIVSQMYKEAVALNVFPLKNPL